MTVTIRPARPEDAPDMATLINAIIARGDTTAHRQPFDAARVIDHFIAGDAVVACHVAEEDGDILGFQSVADGPTSDPNMEAGWCDIGTFVAEGRQGRRIGQALFAATRAALSAAGYRHIDATIRADNLPGLAYYSGLGFRDYAIRRHVPLENGRPVDRISKQFDL